MMYVRPSRGDVERWEKKYGCAGWGYAEMLPVMKRLEDADPSIPSSKYRGRGGMMGVEIPRDRSENYNLFVKSAVERGYAYTDDYNAERQDGVSYAQSSTVNGRRWNTVSGYLLPALARDNPRGLRQRS
jgi:choline dehydrogenase